MLICGICGRYFFRKSPYFSSSAGALPLSHYDRNSNKKYPTHGIALPPSLYFIYNKNMKYIVSLLLCFSVFASSAQPSDKQLKDNIAKLDSQSKALNESIERNMHYSDSVNTARSNEQMGRNLDSFMAERREQERKQMRQAYWRIGFGVLMMVVLVVGLVRKRKGKDAR